MAKKDNTMLIVIGAGAAAFVAYELFLKKPTTVVTPQPTSTTPSTSSLLSTGVSLLSNLFNPAPPAAQPNQQQALESAPATTTASPASDNPTLSTIAPSLNLATTNGVFRRRQFVGGFIR